MIPKIIHYCWFGGKPLPDSVKVYMDSWREYLPDFEIKQWDESNFDICSFEYTQEAYFAKRYAFVSDVARLVALTQEGGLYLDTDILIKQSIPEEMFCKKAFVGFEHEHYVGTGVMASVPHHPIFEEFLSLYKSLHYFEGVKFSLKTNVGRFTQIVMKYGFVMNNQFQELDGFAVYPQILLCGKDWKKGSYATKETIMYHDFQSTWGQERRKHPYMYKFNCVKTIIIWNLAKLFGIKIKLYNEKN